MKPEWKAFLQNDGAEFSDDGSVASFGNPERERRVTTSGNVICDLSHYGLIAIYGDDAPSFLQSQFSNDVQLVNAQRSQLSSYCTPKGRMLANFHIFQRKETYFLRLPRLLLEPILKRLQMYVLRSQVTLEDASSSLVRIGISGPDASSMLSEALTFPPPEQINETSTHNDITVVNMAGCQPRYEIYGLLEPVQDLWNRLNVHCAPVGADCWGLLNVLAGIPMIQPATSEAFVPQMTNLELIDGVNFKKGCYPGQEIVSRMQYLGNLKRRMYRIQITADQADPGDEIVSDEKTENTVVGRIVEAYPDSNGELAGLAVLQISVVEANSKLRLKAEKNSEVRLASLPYSLTGNDYK